MYKNSGIPLVFTLIALGAMLAVLTLVMCAQGYAENNIGVIYSHVLDDMSGGVTGSYGAANDIFEFDISGDLQVGDAYDTGIHTELAVDFGYPIGIKGILDAKGKGTQLDDLGFQLTPALAVNVPIKAIDVDIGIGGMASNPFAPETRHSVLADKGDSDLSDVPDKDLPVVGLPFKTGTSVNAYVAFGVEAWSIKADVKGLIELWGEGEKQHQINTRFTTGRNFGPIDLFVTFDVSLMSYQDIIYREFGSNISGVYPF